MKLSATDLGELAALAIDVAAEAGEMVGASRPVEIERKNGGESLASQVVTEIDRRAEEIIIEGLASTRSSFALGLLSEEVGDDGSRLTAEHFWCIDPLDGTLPFIEGVPGYAVSVALVRSDGTPLIGVIYDPIDRSVLHAIRGAGAFRDGQPWLPSHTSSAETLSVFADRSFLSAPEYDRVVDGLDRIALDRDLQGVHIRATAGAVMNASGVLGNDPACYFKTPNPSGGGSLWDFAATACLFNEAGAVATDMYGDSLDLNRADSTSMGHCGVLYASDADLAAQIRRLWGG